MDDGANLEKMTVDLRENLRNNPPLTGSYSPKRGDLCVAPFSADGQWYRARVEAIRGGKAEVLFIDYGNVGGFFDSYFFLERIRRLF